MLVKKLIYANQMNAKFQNYDFLVFKNLLDLGLLIPKVGVMRNYVKNSLFSKFFFFNSQVKNSTAAFNIFFFYSSANFSVRELVQVWGEIANAYYSIFNFVGIKFTIFDKFRFNNFKLANSDSLFPALVCAVMVNVLLIFKVINFFLFGFQKILKAVIA